MTNCGKIDKSATYQNRARGDLGGWLKKNGEM